MRKAVCFALLALAAHALAAAPASSEFSRAIAYYLIGDADLAQKYMDEHFASRRQPTVRLAFALLLKDDKWEATKQFSDYLESDHRNLEALTGISLATADVGNSLAIDNLNKVLRMDPGYAPAYLCLGHEYALRGDFPAAEEYYVRSMKYAAVPEFKVLLADLYLRAGEAQKAFDLIRPEADAAPGNYFFALGAARACLKLEGCAVAGYIEQALRARPGSREAQLLQAQQLLRAGELRPAKALLAKLKFPAYNPEYSLTFAEVLLGLRDRDAERYLYEVFAQSPWDPLVNKLLGLLHLRRKDASVPNWIRRALLAGMPAAELQAAFPGSAPVAPPSLPAFAIKKLQWLGPRRLLAAGALRSGEKERLLVLDADTLRTIRSFEYEGAIQAFYPAPRLDKVVFATSAVENEKVYLYTLTAERDAYRLSPVVGYALDMASALVAYNGAGTTAYVTDGSLPELAFTAPFSLPGAYGRRTPIYPNYPFPVYAYNYADGSWTPLRTRTALAAVPIPAVRRYLAVAEASRRNADVAKLLERGSGLDVTSAVEMSIQFAADGDAFLFVLSDLKNAFQAWAYDARRDRLTRFDESMFLGDKYYAPLDLIAFRPERDEILVVTRDKLRNLFQFNYRSLLYKKIASDALAVVPDADGRSLYLLNERDRSLYFSEASLERVTLSPFSRRRYDSRRDLAAIVDCSDPTAVYVATFNGELLKLDEEGNFSGRQVALAGALHQVAPDRRRAAAFINGRLYVLGWQE